jgi:hypothetical protein
LETDLAFVLLELAFAFAFRADAAALLAEVAPGASEARQRIRHAGEVHLNARFAGLGPGAENIENDLLAIRDGHAGELLPVSLLRRAQLVVKNENIALQLFGEIDDLLRFAGPDEIARVLFAMIDELPLDNRNAEGVDKLFQFFE